MTVLPDAPIDPATGLPIPTIAVATDGGVSVIKDDGTVVDITNSDATVARSVEFLSNNKIACHLYDYRRGITVFTIPGEDLVRGNHYLKGVAEEWYEGFDGATGSYIGDLRLIPSTVANLGVENHIAEQKNTLSIANPAGLNTIDRNLENPTEGMIAHTTSTYNTGWMNGDIKLATLSDTDDTDLVGSELVTNGTFDTDISGWTETDTNNQMTPSHNAGALRMTSTGNTSNAVWMGQTITGLTVGQLYTVSADVTITGSASGGVILHAPYITSFPSINSSGAYSFTFKATGTSHEIRAYVAAGFTTGSTVDFDNISLRVAEQDRSVNGNGLQVFGTVQKNPVATGADLVGYGGGLTDRLVLPSSEGLNFGLGDFCISVWAKQAFADLTIVYNGDGTYLYPENGMHFWLNGGYVKYSMNSGLRQVLTPSGNSNWALYNFVRKDGIVHLYQNGVLFDSSDQSTKQVTSTEDASILSGFYNNNPNNRAALLRISGTAPTAEQIKKIYEDEKVLFQENAKATLHGTSDAVTALAYDDTTELLHVGTSAGRSVFQGLRRVDNTTDAVGTAISASNGLVAEE
jgi:hypothetical protein